MTNDISFAVIKPRNGGATDERIGSLGDELRAEMMRRESRDEALVWARVFFSDIINQLPAIKGSALGGMLDACATSFVEQPPLDGSKITIMACFAKQGRVETIAPDAKRIVTPTAGYVFHTVRLTADEAATTDGREQTRLAFEKHKALLAQRGMTVADNTVRTWLFVRDIDRTYADVVKGRNEFFADNGLTTKTHFIASTGICGYSENTRAVVAVDFLSQENLDARCVKYLQALDHLNPTAEYGVAFERGTAVSMPAGTAAYISGTASIDKHGSCIYLNDAVKQTERLIDNIEALLADGGMTLADVRMVITYLRDAADRDTVERVLNSRLAHAEHVVTLARVCRPQWLVESECIAVKRA